MKPLSAMLLLVVMLVVGGTQGTLIPAAELSARCDACKAISATIAIANYQTKTDSQIKQLVQSRCASDYPSLVSSLCLTLNNTLPDVLKSVRAAASAADTTTACVDAFVCLPADLTTDLPRRSDNKKTLDQLVNLYPDTELVWKWLLSLTEVPRPCRFTSKVSRWLAEIGRRMGGTVQVDTYNNVAIKFAATTGHESDPGVVVQAHMDQIPATAKGVVHDWNNDPVLPYLDLTGTTPRLLANGTNIGADNGNGIAIALAIAEQRALFTHPQIELLLTADEDVGLVGVTSMTPNELLSTTAKYLINVDADTFTTVLIGCAGGATRNLYLPLIWAALPESGYSYFSVTISDLKAGHSGLLIASGGGSAIKWMSSIISQNPITVAGTEFRIVSITNCGTTRNTIAQMCTMTLGVPTAKLTDFTSALQTQFDLLQQYYTTETAAQLTITTVASVTATTAPTGSSSRTALKFLDQLPHGVYKWNEVLPTLVDTSNNVGTVAFKGTEMQVVTLTRSASDIVNYPKMVEQVATSFGGRFEVPSADYPGWQPDPTTHLVTTTLETYQELYQFTPAAVAKHIGLEPGVLLNAKFVSLNLEAVALGPTSPNAHLITENIEVDTMAKHHSVVKTLITKLVIPMPPEPVAAHAHHHGYDLLLVLMSLLTATLFLLA